MAGEDRTLSGVGIRVWIVLIDSEMFSKYILHQCTHVSYHKYSFDGHVSINTADLDQTAPTGTCHRCSLIWVYTVCNVSIGNLFVCILVIRVSKN